MHGAHLMLPAGYYGVGPVCWKKCSDGWSDTGTSCQKWASSYGKGCCCTIFSRGCCHNCQSGYTDTGCSECWCHMYLKL